MKKKISCLVVVLLIFFQALSFGAVTVQDLKLPKNFYLSKSPEVKIVSVQETPKFPGFLTFSITSPHGSYTVNGLTNFQKCLREIDVIEQLKAQDEDTGGGVVAGAGESLSDTGRGLKNLVVSPVDSAKGVGKGIGKLGGKIGGAFRKKEEGEKGDGFLGGAKRDIAKQLGVDVYSRNVYLQEKMEAMAKSRMGGRGIVMVASFIIPVGAIAGAIVTAGGLNTSADKMVDDNDRGDLFKMNEKALMALGFPHEKVIRFLNHPYYTPRELTYMRFYLEKLKGIQGLEAILDQATKVDSEIPANKILYETQIAANFTGIDPLAAKLILVSEGIILANKDKITLITAYDYVDNSVLGNQLADKALSFRQSLGKKSAEISNGGAVTALYGGAVLLKGIKVQRMCLFEAASSQPEV
jgi:hypothetical protein